MFKLKIFLKASTKKLKKLSMLKNRSLNAFILFLTKERNKHFDTIRKHLIVFIAQVKTMSITNDLFINLINDLFINSVEYLNSKSLKRLNIRAKGRSDIIKKRNSYLIITIMKKKEPHYTILGKKNYLNSSYGKKN